MFTGIVEAQGVVTSVEKKTNLLTITVEVPNEFVNGIKTGASVAVDGVCLTVIDISNSNPQPPTSNLSFDLMEETLQKTTFGNIEVGTKVNVERSLKAGDEIGGHIVSGHVHGVAIIKKIDEAENKRVITFEAPTELSKYIFPKGFIALDGVSLTVVDTSNSNSNSNSFSVSLIPETLERTSFGRKNIGDKVNIEVDQQTRIIVDTLERLKNPEPKTQNHNL